MVTPLVSIIIPNYNYGHYLRQALDSVLAQTCQDLEIIVVDDGSQDSSESVVRTYGERIRFIKQENQGVSAARNRGAQESSGEFIAFLDADDLWLPTKLEKQLQRLCDDPGIGLVHCGVQEIDSSGALLKTLLEGMEGWVSKELLLFERPVILASGSTGLVPRTTFKAVGGFDERLGTSADWDFCYRISVRQPVAFVPEVLVYYRAHGSNMHANVGAMEHDMMIGYEKAFSSDNGELRYLRRQCYGNLHMVLAGSFFRSGQRARFARHALKSLLLTPGNLSRLVGFPFRWWWRERESQNMT
jgi:glycosyltransferase involved in cell wall biosynthesis